MKKLRSNPEFFWKMIYRVTVANPYGYTEEISVGEFLERTSFEAYEKMPLFFKLAFAMGIFEKNTIFTVQPVSQD